MIYIYTNCNEYFKHLQQLHQYVEWQNQRIDQLQEIIQKMQNELKEMKQKPMTNIEKIEYKFDQLKVETLEGTLNIGLNPMNEEAIEDFSVSQDKMNVPNIRQTHSSLVGKLEGEIYNYLNEEGYSLIESIEEQEQSRLDQSYREFMVEDIRKQINERIHYYLAQHQTELQNPARERQVYAVILAKVKNDIHQAITAFIRNLPDTMKGGNHP